MQPLQFDMQPAIQQANRTTHKWTTTRCRTPWENQSHVKTEPSAPAAHTSYLSSPAAATLHGKTQGFVLRLPPQHKSHARFMQPLQCDLQPAIQQAHTLKNHTLQNTPSSSLPFVTTSLRHHFPIGPHFHISPHTTLRACTVLCCKVSQVHQSI